MDSFAHSKYYAKKKFFKLFGGAIRIFDETGSTLLFYIKQKAFKLKEEIIVYADESEDKEILKIKARSIIDLGATYDITDASTDQKVGALRRKALKSILKDTWEILDTSDDAIATVAEDSLLMALLRRFLSNLIPQSFHIDMGDDTVGILKQTFNPFVPQFRVDFSMDSGNKLDRRLGIGAVILLQIIEGRQQ